MARLAEQAGRLEPAEDLLDELPLSLAHDVAGVARGAASIALERFAVFWATCGVTCSPRRPATKSRVS